MRDTRHGITLTDEMVRGYPGTVARCLCGRLFAWGVRDGSAEADSHAHMLAVDPEYRAKSEALRAAWVAENEVRQAARVAVPTVSHPEHLHNCSCHLGAPCGPCENCRHPAGDFDDCSNDCQECEVDHAE